MSVEKNPLVRSGEFTRVFVAEVQPGEVNAFGQTVESVVTQTVGGYHRAGIRYTDGSVAPYRDGSTTILIRTDSLRD